jgi:hypothetical protein
VVPRELLNDMHELNVVTVVHLASLRLEETAIGPGVAGLAVTPVGTRQTSRVATREYCARGDPTCRRARNRVDVVCVQDITPGKP